MEAGTGFMQGDSVGGLRAGVELATRNGMFQVQYETAHDRLNGTYHTVGGPCECRAPIGEAAQVGESVGHAGADIQEPAQPTVLADAKRFVNEEGSDIPRP